MRLGDRTRALLLMMVIFAGGALTGGAVVQRRTTALLREVLEGPATGLEARLKLLLLERGLSLTSEQRERLRPILEDYASQIRAQRERIEPEIAPLRAAERERVRALLEPEQREKYDRRLTEIDAALGRKP